MTPKRIILTILFLSVLVPLTTCNLRLYGGVPTGVVSKEMPAQLQFLRTELEADMGEQMQRLFPEGYFFSYLLYGLSWVNIGIQEPAMRDQALQEARWAYVRVDSPQGYAAFPQNLDPPYGMFYNGWRNYLLLGILLLQPNETRNVAEWNTFTAQSEALAAAFANSPTPFPSSYTNQSWPVDALPAIVSLRGYGHLANDDRFEPIIETWLQESLALLDPEMDLMPHRTDYRSGRMLDGTRATSQTLILRFLAEIDPVLAQKHYDLFRQNYVVTRLGLPGVLEYPPLRPGVADVDSGPLLFGVSLSATAVMMGTSRVFEDMALAIPLWQGGEFLGGAIRWRGERKYAFGALPIGDAFVVWSKTGVLWLGEIDHSLLANTYPPILPWWWRLPYHAISLLILWAMWRVITVGRDA